MRTTIRIIIGLLLAALVWWIGPLIAIGVYRPLGWLLLRQVLVAGFLIWGFWPLLVRFWVWVGMGARQLKVRPAAKSYDAITGRLLDLERQLRARWQRLPMERMARLRGRLQKAHRSFLPWYIVMGASGSGKTSLVRLAHAQSGRRSGAPDTSKPERSRSGEVDFWCTDTAVWIDTTGEWVAPEGISEPAHNTWKQLLSGIKRMRSHPAVNGVVLCVEIQSLLDFSLEERKRLADVLKGRLTEIKEQLGMVPSAYLALTGLDRLEGAVATLGLMTPEQWPQGMGFSLPEQVDEANADMVDALWRSALEDLEDRLHQQVLYAAPAAGDVTTNLAQLQFVQKIGQLRGNLLDFLHHLVAPGEGESHASLRGVWLGSVATLVDDPHQTPGATPSEGRVMGALWTPLLQQTVLEQGAVWLQRAVTWKSRLLRSLKWSAVAAMTVVGLAWLGWGYLTERDYLEQVWAQFNEGKRLAEAQSAEGQGTTSPLLDIATQMRYARAHVDDTGRFLPTAYVEHSRVADAASSTYHRHLHKTLMPELHNQVQQTLQAQVDGSPGDIYLTLKVYLMLARPDRRNAVDVERWITGRWESMSAGQYSDDDRKMLIAHTRALFSKPDLPGTPEDSNLVLAARAKAAQIPSVTRVLQHIWAQGLPATVNEVSLARAAGFASSMTLRHRSNLPATDAAIPGWYTRAGYIDVVRPRLDKSARATLQEESWVLRDETLSGNAYEIDKAVQKLADATRNQFLQDYIKRWRSFLNDVTVRTSTGLDDASQVAASMIDPQSPLSQLVRFAGRETTLTGNYEGDVDSWIDRQKHNLEKGRRAIVGEIAGEHYRAKLLPEHAVEDHFDSIRRLAMQLTQSSGNAGTNPMARLFEPVYRQLGLVNGAMQAGQILPEYDAFSRMRNEAARQPEPIRGVMLDLIDTGSSMTSKQSSSVLNRGAVASTKLVCDQGLSGRYPLLRGGKSEAGVQDFERLFGPQGVMAEHFKERLAAYVDTSSTPWRARVAESAGSSLVNAEIVRSYEIAERIRASTLDESGRLRITSVLRFVDMDPQLAEAQLDVAGQTLRYSHGVSSPRRIDWSAQSANPNIRLTLKAIDGRTDTLNFNGLWALFRFFDAGRLDGGAADRRETLHQSSLGSVRMEWQAVSTPAPLWSDMLSSFRCPR
jgi:type VI secretion system protein ImpL